MAVIEAGSLLVKNAKSQAVETYYSEIQNRHSKFAWSTNKLETATPIEDSDTNVGKHVKKLRSVASHNKKEGTKKGTHKVQKGNKAIVLHKKLVLWAKDLGVNPIELRHWS